MSVHDRAVEEYYKVMDEEVSAFAPEPPPGPQEKRYKVTGEQSVMDHQPGEEFAATLPFETEADYLEYGHLSVVSTEQSQQQEATVPVGTVQTEPTSESEGEVTNG